MGMAQRSVTPFRLTLAEERLFFTGSCTKESRVRIEEIGRASSRFVWISQTDPYKTKKGDPCNGSPSFAVNILIVLSIHQSSL